MRSNVGRSIRALEGQFAIELKIATGIAQSLEGLTEFAHMHTARWKQEQGSTYFEQPGNLEFERELCSLATEAGWYRLYTLYADGKPIAGSLGYVGNNRYYAALLAKLPELDRYSAGTFLMSQLIQQCIHNGWTSLDMTRGDEAYKHRWNGVETRNFHVRIFANRLALVQVAILDGLYRFAAEVQLLHRIRAAVRRLKASKAIDELPHSAHSTG
jgi:CelD/BcsL family acetyltransferase involved in cellulose biosynthesis